MPQNYWRPLFNMKICIAFHIKLQILKILYSHFREYTPKKIFETLKPNCPQYFSYVSTPGAFRRGSIFLHVFKGIWYIYVVSYSSLFYLLVVVNTHSFEITQAIVPHMKLSEIVPVKRALAEFSRETFHINFM